MKKPLAICSFIMLVSLASIYAQPANKIIQQQMKSFVFWTGQWSGEAHQRRGPGEPIKINQTENIYYKLDGTLLVVEGTGKSPEDGSTIFSAFGILTFNETKGEFEFKSYLQDGKSVDAWFEVIAEQQFQWGFEVPTGKIRYTITLDQTAKTWIEKGEFSQDGTTWFPFFDMALKKI